VAFGAGFPSLSHRFARLDKSAAGVGLPLSLSGQCGVESPIPPRGEQLPGAGCKLTAAQNGRHEGLDQGRPAWDIRGIAGSGVASTPGNRPGHGLHTDASGTHLYSATSACHIADSWNRTVGGDSMGLTFDHAGERTVTDGGAVIGQVALLAGEPALA
jgi:hypothetical protein